jgi:cell division septation protein DedD
MATLNKRTDVIAADEAMIEGVTRFLMQIASLPVGNQVMTPADVVKVFQDRVNAGQAVKTAEAARTAAIKADRDERARTAATVRAFRRIVLGMFQESPDTLAVFGLKAPKVVKRTVATKSTAVAKNKATRTARGTKGKKQKSKIHGTPPAASPGPTASPAGPAPKPTA